METVEQVLVVGLLRLGGNSGGWAHWETVGCVGNWSRNVMAREPTWEQNGLTSMIKIMQILLAKCQSAKAASHQPGVMGSCLTNSHMCMPCLPSR